MTGLRLCVVGRPLVGNRTGIGVHTAQIASRLQFDDAVTIASHRAIEDREGLDHCHMVVDPAPLGVLWQQALLPGVVRREECDVLWAAHTTLPLSLSIPAVSSLHDFTSITMPHRHRLKTILSFNLFIRASLEKAVKIASASTIAADEAMRGFGIPSSKIEIVYNGVDEFFRPGEDEREDFILYVGTLEPRKGVPDLLEAWHQLGSRPRLVLAGDPGWGTTPLLRRAREARAIESGHLQIMGFISRDELRSLYQRCALFVYPSHFEGFGLPPLEAMACGAPVVTTTGGAIPEVVGDAAEIVRPGMPDDLSAAIRRVLSSAKRRSELVGRGHERVRQFSWSTAATRFAELFREAAR